MSERAPGERPPKPPWWQWSTRLGRFYWVGVVLCVLVSAGHAWRFAVKGSTLTLAAAIAFGVQAAWMTASGLLVRRNARNGTRSA